ncbi:MAG: maleylpyruvate isomerase N-terminal domain-containing protein [Chloroflexi bacterium]|nr:maleylpyruvate isomerase N-terminal domain-containing protein [Chloroflexota bacterium]
MTAKQDFAAWVSPLAARDRDARAEAARLARSLSAGDLTKPTADAGWSVGDELKHMASSDPDFLKVLGAILGGEAVDMTVFADIDARNATHLAERRERSMDETATELEESGRSMGVLLARLTDEDESRQPEGLPFPLRALIDGYTMHAPYHVEQIKAALGAPETTGR